MKRGGAVFRGPNLACGTPVDLRRIDHARRLVASHPWEMRRLVVATVVTLATGCLDFHLTPMNFNFDFGSTGNGCNNTGGGDQGFGQRHVAYFTYICTDYEYPPIDIMCDEAIRTTQTPAVARGASFDITAHRPGAETTPLTVATDDPQVVEVGAGGTLVAVGAGTTALRALDDSAAEVDRRSIDVLEATELRGAHDVTLDPGGEAWISVTPSTGTIALAGRFACVWSTSDSSVATVVTHMGRARVDGVAPGSATVTATCLGLSTTFDVQVGLVGDSGAGDAAGGG